MGSNTQTIGSSFATGVSVIPPLPFAGLTLPPMTAPVASQNGAGGLTANQAYYFRNMGGVGVISQIGFCLLASGGNIQVGIYNSVGGRNPPSTLIAASPVVASVITGYQTLSLGGSYPVDSNTYFAAVASSTASTWYFIQSIPSGVNGLGAGLCHYQTAPALPLPVIANPVGALIGGVVIMMGIS